MLRQYDFPLYQIIRDKHVWYVGWLPPAEYANSQWVWTDWVGVTSRCCVLQPLTNTAMEHNTTQSEPNGIYEKKTSLYNCFKNMCAFISYHTIYTSMGSFLFFFWCHIYSRMFCDISCLWSRWCEIITTSIMCVWSSSLAESSGMCVQSIIIWQKWLRASLCLLPPKLVGERQDILCTSCQSVTGPHIEPRQTRMTAHSDYSQFKITKQSNTDILGEEAGMQGQGVTDFLFLFLIYHVNIR